MWNSMVFDRSRLLGQNEQKVFEITNKKIVVHSLEKVFVNPNISIQFVIIQGVSLITHKSKLLSFHL